MTAGASGFTRAMFASCVPGVNVPFGSGNIAEDELGELVRSALFPDLRNVLHAQIHLALGFVRQ